MATLTGQINLSIAALLGGTIDLGTLQLNTAISRVINYDNGTGSSQANQLWSDTRTLTASSTENLDLAASLVDAFGTTLTFTKVKAIIVTASTGNTNGVQVARASSNGVPLFIAASDAIQLEAGDTFAFFGPVGKTVTASTGDILTITNSAGSTSVTYDIIIIGTV